MKKRLSLLGSVLGWSGVAVCCLSALAKLLGAYYLFGMESLSIFTGGIGLVVFGIMTKVEALGQD
ncbi:hypothetical protein Thiowin_02769 [Thiorhodovibrio winogradskyi]|uniref:Uncharacterized protein n=2 Tax=Thiorhodovibrio winogradskyi TaxID=77007 RepID=A0ABZ0SB00_9GAMM